MSDAKRAEAHSENLHVKLTPQLMEAVWDLAERNERSLSTEVRRALKAHIERESENGR
jgi:predicted transcriptional regulator